MKIEEFVQAAKEASLIGGLVLEENFRRVEDHLIEEKGEKDFVSYVDRTSEERIREFLVRKFPDHRVVGEEEGGEDRGDFVWYIDPLDGTKNYIAGFPIFGVSVGLSYRGEPIAGAVYLPVFKDLYWAGKGTGAYKNGKRIGVSTTSDLKLCVVAYGFSSRPIRELETYWRIFKRIFVEVAAMRRPGAAAVDLCLTADGVFEGMIEFELSPWDILAGAVILKEAGGDLRVIEQNGRLDVIASNGRIQRYLEKVVLSEIGEDR
jgi:myo-inositol-1(or 4)-monophosphatase